MSSGYVYGEKEPTEKCPYCGALCYADFCDVGIGYTQCGPFHCTECHASEIGPYDEERELSAEEKAKGWYKPGAEPGSSANVIDGRIVTVHEAERAYRNEFVGNPLWEAKGYVAEWWKNLRAPK